MRDPRNFFTAEDCDYTCATRTESTGINYVHGHFISAHKANTLLAQYLEQCPRVWGEFIPDGGHFWDSGQDDKDTHTARLIAIEPIGKEGGE